MTAKEAITLLQSRVDLIKKDYPDIVDYAEALEMAIEALNQFADDSKKVSSSCGQENDLISRQDAIDAIDDYLDEYSGLDEEGYHGEKWCAMAEAKMVIENLPPAQPKILACGEGELNVPDTNVGDMISKKAVLRGLTDIAYNSCKTEGQAQVIDYAKTMVCVMPSAQIEQRYTEEELRVFAHGISLSLLSKRSAQHWRYDEDTATEIKFLERLYEKVGADMRGE